MLLLARSLGEIGSYVRQLKLIPRTRFAGRWAQALLVAAVVSLAISGTGMTDASARFESLGHKMMCTCGCAQVLLECNHVGCPVSGGMRDELAAGISGGQADAAILDGFVTRYGAVVLTAPTFHGFDLVAWIMPFAVSLVALLGTIYLVRHWARQQKLATAAHVELSPSQSVLEENLRERIRRETGTDEVIR